MKFQDVDCTVIMGMRGCGKSHLGKLIQKNWPRRVIFDPMDEYPEEKGRVIVRGWHAFEDEIRELEAKNPAAFELVVKFDPETSTEEQEQVFDHCLRACYYLENVLIVIEEVQLFSSPHYLPDWLRNVYLIGRHKGLGIIATSQRPGEVHKTIISQSHHKFCGKIEEGNDLKYLENFFRDRTPELADLKPRNFLYKSDAGITQISTEGKNPALSKRRKSRTK